MVESAATQFISKAASAPDRLFVLVSGLPASGKTSLARRLAPILQLPLIDKDDILEALFDATGARDLATRQTLSRASDEVLKKIAEASHGAVLSSFWRHLGITVDSGTPFNWVFALSPRIVEIHCKCSPTVAARRFKLRRRHPGHCDADKSEKLLMEQFEALAKRGPLGAGQVIVVDTQENSDIEAIVRELTETLQSSVRVQE